MARPIHADAEETKKKLIDSATRLFSEKGVDGTSVRSISHGAGKSLATISLYFGSKEGLYKACLDSMFNDLATIPPKVEQALVQASSGRDISAVAVRTGFRLLRKHHRALKLYFRALFDPRFGDIDSRHDLQRSVIQGILPLLSQYLDVPPQKILLPLQTVINAMTRYAVSSDEQLRSFLEEPKFKQEKIVQKIEDHLVEIAFQLVLAPHMPHE